MSEKQPKDDAVSRRDKLAAELRANLKRRKTRMRTAAKGKPAGRDESDDEQGR